MTSEDLINILSSASAYCRTIDSERNCGKIILEILDNGVGIYWYRFHISRIITWKAICLAKFPVLEEAVINMVNEYDR